MIENITFTRHLGPGSTYLKLVSGQAGVTLCTMLSDPDIAGHTDPASLSVIATYLSLIPGCRMLQLGTYIGVSTVVFGDVLRRLLPAGTLTTVDPDQRTLDKARRYSRSAGIEATVDFILGSSTNPETLDSLAGLAPFDAIYIDASHAYGETKLELAEFTQPRWLTENGLIFMHDAAELAKDFDPTHQGGVRLALDEFRQTTGLQTLIFEPPLFPCGLAIIAPRRRP